MAIENLKQIKDEQAIVWVDGTARDLPYVREGMMPMPFRARAPSARRFSRNIVAYAVLRPDAPHFTPGRFQRRYWWLASHDPYNDGGAPIEAVDPTSIAAGHLSGPLTDEQWNRKGEYRTNQ